MEIRNRPFIEERCYTLDALIQEGIDAVRDNHIMASHDTKDYSKDISIWLIPSCYVMPRSCCRNV
jgi:hypothetical protein